MRIWINRPVMRFGFLELERDLSLDCLRLNLISPFE